MNFPPEIFSENGRIRLNRILEYLENYGFSDVYLELYQKWVQTDEFIILEKCDDENHKPVETIIAKCAKRGNDVYLYRVKKRIREFNKLLSAELDFSKSRNYKTNMLMVTLTNDQHDDIPTSWKKIGEAWNRYMTNLRKKYGKIEVIRTWESTQAGYPHIHALLLFKEQQFSTFQDKNGKWRILGKSEFENWEYGFVDVLAVKAIKAVYFYVLKYVVKCLKGGDDVIKGLPPQGETEGEGGLKTLAYCWLFRKRAFSISKGFQSALDDLIVSKHNSNLEVENGQVLLAPKKYFWRLVKYKDVFSTWLADELSESAYAKALNTQLTN